MENTPKILIILTGGTILSSIQEKCIDVDPSKGDDLLFLYQKNEETTVDFEIRRPYTILSENAEPEHWLRIIETIRLEDLSLYQGVIIAHGSDTLPYTASALSYGLDAIRIPMVLVAANYALGHPQSNALDNFTASVNFILNQQLPGIYAIYKNKDQHMNVHLGTRLLEADFIHDDFTSFGGLPLGVLDHRGLCCHPSPLNPTMLKLYNPELSLVPWVSEFKHEVLGLRAYPGLNYQTIQLRNTPVKAVLHSLYHCGSGKVSGREAFSLLEFIRDNPQVDHYMLSYKDIHGDLYDSCHQLICAGGIPLENISFEAAITKLYFAYNQPEYSPKDYMHREFFYEFLRETPENGYVI